MSKRITRIDPNTLRTVAWAEPHEDGGYEIYIESSDEEFLLEGNPEKEEVLEILAEECAADHRMVREEFNETLTRLLYYETPAMIMAALSDTIEKVDRGRTDA